MYLAILLLLGNWNQFHIRQVYALLIGLLNCHRMIKLIAFQVRFVDHILNENRLLIRVFKLSFLYKLVIAISKASDAGLSQRGHGMGLAASL